MATDARVLLWGSLIGAVSWLEDRELGVFQYAPDFLASGIQIAPLTMPLSGHPYEFPSLDRDTFRGLPGLLADSLPDFFGNAIIDAWLASQGRSLSGFNPVERLCYVGTRGMGALEFQPALSMPQANDHAFEVERLVALSNKILNERSSLHGAFSGTDDQAAIEDILRVGTSAGGARAKAILAWNPATNEFRSGQLPSREGFEYWIMKFDGISSASNAGISSPQGYGLLEYAYYLMATRAGIRMSPCRLHSEGGRNHFMTKRFDRTDRGGKIHMQSLGAIVHYDYRKPASYSYEQAIVAMKRLDLGQTDIEEQVRRAFFNVIARNCDDHVKNIAFLMDRSGEWALSPAYDVTYSWNPDGQWTSAHQMSINGKRDDFTRDDLLALSSHAGIKRPRAREMLDHINSVVQAWPDIAASVGIPENTVRAIQKAHRTSV